jgi:hypothetical protein
MSCKTLTSFASWRCVLTLQYPRRVYQPYGHTQPQPSCRLYQASKHLLQAPPEQNGTLEAALRSGVDVSTSEIMPSAAESMLRVGAQAEQVLCMAQQQA